MSSKWILDSSSMQESFFAESGLVGIASSLPAYRFCWLMNQAFATDFVRETELDISMPGASFPYYFAVYQYELPLNGGRYLMYQLKNGQKRLMPELKNLDFLWLVQRGDASTVTGKVVEYLRKIPEVELALELQPEKLRSLGNLLV